MLKIKIQSPPLTTGLSLFEVVLAVALFGLVASALFSLSLGGAQGLEAAEDEAAARRLAWSGLAETRATLASAWNEFPPGTPLPPFSGNGFQRQINLGPVCRDGAGVIAACPAVYRDPHLLLASAAVSWLSGSGASRQIELPTYFGNWDSLDWESGDWSGGSGQAIFSNPSRYESDDGNLETATPGQLSLREITTTDGSPNPSFDSSVSPWNFGVWDVDPGEVIPTGAWQAVTAGGSPNGIVTIAIPGNASNDQIGGYWEQAVAVPEDGLPLTCSTDWRVSSWSVAGNQVNDFRSFIFLDSVPGAPVIGTEVWASPVPGGTGNWQSAGSLDCSSFASAAGTYYLKIAVWLDARPSRTGPIVVDFDNASLVWETASYPSEGILQSSAFDLGSASPLQVVEWDEDLNACAPACGVRLSVRTAPDAGGAPGVWGSWMGPTGPSDEFALSTGELVPASENGRVWAQYRARLFGDGTGTPLLRRVRLNYR